jgi:putative hydrolase of the HAD superfamily
LKLGIVSNFDSRVYTVMRSLGILSFFDAITISSESGFAKPDPRIFEAATRSLSVSPSRTLLVGDNPRDDVEAGNRAGLNAVLVDRYGSYPDRGLRRIASLREVIDLIDGSA